MDPAKLEQMILEDKARGEYTPCSDHVTQSSNILVTSFTNTSGYLPFFVSCTAGTTVIGAFDPLLQVADICKKYDLWLHVDVSTV